MNQRKHAISEVIKRSFDFMVALAAVVILSPVLLLLGLIIKLCSPGQIFYRGVRIG